MLVIGEVGQGQRDIDKSDGVSRYKLVMNNNKPQRSNSWYNEYVKQYSDIIV